MDMGNRIPDQELAKEDPVVTLSLHEISPSVKWTKKS